MLWTNEREVPEELLALLDDPETPKDLWVLILKARDEVEDFGAVTYVTQANIERRCSFLSSGLNPDFHKEDEYSRGYSLSHCPHGAIYRYATTPSPASASMCPGRSLRFI